MQKSLVIVVAVCLISVHAFVKRDAPATANTNTLEEIQKQFGDLGKQFNENFDKIKEALKPDELQNLLNDAIGKASKALDDFKAKSGTQNKE